MFAIYGTRIVVLWGLATVVATGCGRSSYTPAATSDPAAARDALVTALDAWQSGATAAALAAATPRLYVRDEDWSAEHRLNSYSILDHGEMFGHSVRFVVDLEVEPAASRPARKRARYVVDTNPVLSVARDDSDV